MLHNVSMVSRALSLILFPALALTVLAQAPTPPAAPQGPKPKYPRPPTRDPHTPGYVQSKELPDGTLPSPDADGNFILGPTHPAAPEMAAVPATPHGTVLEFTMSSSDSKFYPGIMRDPGPLGTPDPNDPAKLIVTSSHPAPWNRKVGVYVPSAYVPGSIAPFIVGADGIDRSLFTALDSLIAAHKLPVMIGISIANGGGDAQGSQRGLEYDTMSGRYAEFVEQEVLPLVEAQAHVKLTHDPDARAATGGSSGAACALIPLRQPLDNWLVSSFKACKAFSCATPPSILVPGWTLAPSCLCAKNAKGQSPAHLILLLGLSLLAESSRL
jgi:enterochelin esterase family protein